MTHRLKLTNEKLDKISYLQGSNGITNAVQRFELLSQEFQKTKPLVKDALVHHKRDGTNRKEMLAKLIELKWRLIDIEHTLNGNEYYLNYTVTKEEYQEMVMLDKQDPRRISAPRRTETRDSPVLDSTKINHPEQDEAHVSHSSATTQSTQMSNAIEIIAAVSGGGVSPIYVTATTKNTDTPQQLSKEEQDFQKLEGLMENEQLD